MTERFLYLHNFEPSRWPSGNPETGYLDTDGGATKTFILDARRKNADDPFWTLCFGLRPQEELYDLGDDPSCVKNLAAAREQIAAELKQRLFNALRRQGDPRLLGRGEIFDQYPHANPAHQNFHERYLRGEKLKAGWVNESDFERLER